MLINQATKHTPAQGLLWKLHGRTLSLLNHIDVMTRDVLLAR
jgi:hypothetical protein